MESLIAALEAPSSGAERHSQAKSLSDAIVADPKAALPFLERLFALRTAAYAESVTTQEMSYDGFGNSTGYTYDSTSTTEHVDPLDATFKHVLRPLCEPELAAIFARAPNQRLEATLAGATSAEALAILLGAGRFDIARFGQWEKVSSPVVVPSGTGDALLRWAIRPIVLGEVYARAIDILIPRVLRACSDPDALRKELAAAATAHAAEVKAAFEPIFAAMSKPKQYFPVNTWQLLSLAVIPSIADEIRGNASHPPNGYAELISKL